jgi:hypothetical protein
MVDGNVEELSCSFRDLSVGEDFRFPSGDFCCSVGICRKVSARKYRYFGVVSGGTEVSLYTRVGTIHVLVIKVDLVTDPE